VADAGEKQLVKANGPLLMTIRGAELDTLKGQGLSVFTTNRWALGNCQNRWGKSLLAKLTPLCYGSVTSGKTIGKHPAEL